MTGATYICSKGHGFTAKPTMKYRITIEMKSIVEGDPTILKVQHVSF